MCDECECDDNVAAVGREMIPKNLLTEDEGENGNLDGADE